MTSLCPLFATGCVVAGETRSSSSGTLLLWMGFHDLNTGLPFAMLLSPICDCKPQCLFSNMITSFRYYNPVRTPLDRCECASDNIHPFLTKCDPQDSAHGRQVGLLQAWGEESSKLLLQMEHYISSPLHASPLEAEDQPCFIRCWAVDMA